MNLDALEDIPELDMEQFYNNTPNKTVPKAKGLQGDSINLDDSSFNDYTNNETMVNSKFIDQICNKPDYMNINYLNNGSNTILANDNNVFTDINVQGLMNSRDASNKKINETENLNLKNFGGVSNNNTITINQYDERSMIPNFIDQGNRFNGDDDNFLEQSLLKALDDDFAADRAKSLRKVLEEENHKLKMENEALKVERDTMARHNLSLGGQGSFDNLSSYHNKDTKSRLQNTNNSENIQEAKPNFQKSKDESPKNIYADTKPNFQKSKDGTPNNIYGKTQSNFETTPLRVIKETILESQVEIKNADNFRRKSKAPNDMVQSQINSQQNNEFSNMLYRNIRSNFEIPQTTVKNENLVELNTTDHIRAKSNVPNIMVQSQMILPAKDEVFRTALPRRNAAE